ncbi:MAG: zinc metalloprotease HtpX [Desulfurococcales archaeon]|nr:zinc metalloprotease HtpX [Desulfurococcales archaeon]
MLTYSKLKFAMTGVTAAIIGLATLVCVAIFSIVAPTENLSILILGSLIFVLVIHTTQWILAPKIIEAAYKVRPASEDFAWLKEVIRKIAVDSGLSKTPKAMVAEVSVPNAFAYGNIFSGYRVAVTKGMLLNFPKDEIEAVIAHEVGHIKHKDVEVMMIVSVLPALLFWLGRTLMLFGMFRGSSRRNESAIIPLIGVGLLAFSFVFNLFILYLSRLREYYADSHAALTVPRGAKKLQRALARILVLSRQLRFNKAEIKALGKFRALLINDPELGISALVSADIDRVVEYIKSAKKLLPLELFSSHPDPAKRLRFLDSFLRSSS